MSVQYQPPENHYIELDIIFATEYGINEALLFAKLHRLQNKWEGHTEENGKKWVRLTNEEWQRELPFFSKNTIIRTLKSLEAQGLIFSTTFKGRSKWYRYNPKYVSTQNGYMQLPNLGNPTTQIGYLPRVLIQESLPNKETTTEDLDNFQILFTQHFGKLSHKKTDPLRCDVMATIKEYGLEVVTSAIFTATVDRANGIPRTWGYVKGVLNTPDSKEAKPNDSTSTNTKSRIPASSLVGWEDD